MDPNIRTRWEAFLDPDILRRELVSASMFLTAFELMKGSIIDRVRDFYSCDFDEKGPTLDERRYQSQVLSLNRSGLYASLSWLKNHEAIDDQDLATFERLKACRNQVAHEIQEIILGGSPSNHLDLMPDLEAFLLKVERWWILNVEIPTNPDFDGKEVDEKEILPGPVLGLRLLWDIALGSEEESRFYLDEFRKQT